MRIQAVKATFLGLPAVSSRWSKTWSTGLYRLPANALEDGPHWGPATPDGPLTPHLPAVPVDGSHAHQGGNPLPVQCARFRHMCQQRMGKLLHNAGDAAQQVVLLPPHGALAESLPQTPLGWPGPGPLGIQSAAFAVVTFTVASVEPVLAVAPDGWQAGVGSARSSQHPYPKTAPRQRLFPA